MIEQFQSDFRFVAEVVKQSRLVKEKKKRQPAIRTEKVFHVNETLDLLYAMTGDVRYLEAQEKIRKKEVEGVFSLFEACEQNAREDGIRIGEAQGFKNGEAQGFKNGEAQGFKNGEAQGEKRGEAKMQQLMYTLFDRGDQAGINKVMTASREELHSMYRQFGIS